MDIKRAYLYRFYPDSEQEEILAKTFGCARFVYNYMLKIRTDAWYERQEKVGYHETSALLTELKRNPEYAWLNEVSSVPIQQALRHLQTSFGNFWAKRVKYPTFKKKNNKQSATYASTAFKYTEGKLTIAKMAKPLNIIWSRTLPKAAVVTTVTISKDASGRYFISLLCDDAVAHKPKVERKIGIDLGLINFATLSNGEKVDSPKTFRKHERRLALAQRRLSKKQKGSQNRAKAKLKVARIHANIADARKDFLHKLSTRLINENQVICLETLAISNMKRCRNLAKSISDAGWGEFVRQLEYKGTWYGREIVGIDRWYPSSKRCSGCGFIISKLPLKIRNWTCEKCGSIHDRDINAASNILAVGLAVLAHGENVNPIQS